MSLYFSIKNKITIDDLFIVLRDSSSEYDTEKINVIKFCEKFKPLAIDRCMVVFFSF